MPADDVAELLEIAVTCSRSAISSWVDAPPLATALPDPFDRDVASLVHRGGGLGGDPERPALVGVPFDTTTMGRRGSKHGPAAIRQAMSGLLAYHGGYRADLSQSGGISDVGDVAVVDTDVAETWRRISVVTEALARRRAPMLIIGGDHGLTFPALRGAAAAVPGSIGLISLDAHYDVRPDHRGQPASGVPFRYALERLDGRVDPRACSQIGIAGWENSPLAADYLAERGVRAFSAREVHRDGIDAVLAEVAERAARADVIWLTFDIDAADAAFAPGTNAPTIGGLSSHQFLECAWRLGQLPGVIAADVVEVSPPLDVGSITSLLGAHVLLTAFAALQERRSA
jgi:formimidoylglutamase